MNRYFIIGLLFPTVWYAGRTLMGYNTLRDHSLIEWGEHVDSIGGRWYLDDAERGDIPAQYHLGLCYAEGRGVPQDDALAAKWYEKAGNVELPKDADSRVRTSNIDAQIGLAECYMLGKGMEKNAEKAFEWYLKAAEQGDEVAQFFVARCYENGTGVRRDLAEAKSWYNAAAAKKVEARVKVGEFFLQGLGCDVNVQEAARAFIAAAKQGDAYARYLAGVCYEVGIGVEKNEKAAVREYRDAAEQGHRDALICLARCYEMGSGVHADAKIANSLLVRADAAPLSQRDDAEVLFCMGIYCATAAYRTHEQETRAAVWTRDLGSRVVSTEGQDSALDMSGDAKMRLAVHLFRSAAQRGHAAAKFALGICLERGEGVSPDNAEAMKWYKEAAEQGVAAAAHRLGDYFALRNVPQGEAVEWYKKAAELGLLEASYRVGVCYEKGEGVALDWSEAAAWYKKAAEQGHVESQYALGLCYDKGAPQIQNKAEAVRWYTQAAEQGHVPAQFNLACCYDNGEGVEMNKARADKWYRAAAEQGDERAKQLLLKKEASDSYNATVVQQEYAKVFAQDALPPTPVNPIIEYLQGVRLFEGLDEPANPAKAVEHFMAAAVLGHPGAQGYIAQCYMEGWGMPRSYEECVHWAQRGAAKGDSRALYCLATCYANGYGVEVDRHESMRRYAEARESIKAALAYLCNSEEDLAGVEVSMAQAVRWFKKATEQKDARAQLSLGDCYYGGKGVEKDMAKAVCWYELAAKQGVLEAVFRMGRCYDLGEGVAQSKSEAFKYYQQAAEGGYAEAQFALARCYESGAGTAASESSALRWYRAAAEKGYAPAARKAEEIRSKQERARGDDERRQTAQQETPPPPPQPTPAVNSALRNHKCPSNPQAARPNRPDYNKLVEGANAGCPKCKVWLRALNNKR